MKISYQAILSSKLNPQRRLKEHVVAMINDGNIIQIEVGHGYRVFQTSVEFSQWYEAVS